MDGIDGLLAYGCKGMIENMLEIGLVEALDGNPQKYVDMCLMIMRIIRKEIGDDK